MAATTVLSWNRQEFRFRWKLVGTDSGTGRVNWYQTGTTTSYFVFLRRIRLNLLSIGTSSLSHVTNGCCLLNGAYHPNLITCCLLMGPIAPTWSCAAPLMGPIAQTWSRAASLMGPIAPTWSVTDSVMNPRFPCDVSQRDVSSECSYFDQLTPLLWIVKLLFN